MMTVDDYAGKVIEIMLHPYNAMDFTFEKHEIDWIDWCFDHGIKPSDCVFGLDNQRIAYKNEERRLRMWHRVDELLKRAA